MYNMQNVRELMSDWQIVFQKLRDDYEMARRIMPIPVLLGKSMKQKTMLVNEFAMVLKQSHIIDFMEDAPVLFYKMPYCKVEDTDFSGLHILAQMIAQAFGYKGCFRGCLHIDLTAWQHHEEDAYFDILLGYFSDLRESDIFPVFSMDTWDDQAFDLMLDKMNIYYNLSVIDLNAVEDDTYYEYLVKQLTACGITVAPDAKTIILSCIDKLDLNSAEDAYESLERLAEEWLYQFYVAGSAEADHMTVSFFEKHAQIDQRHFNNKRRGPKKSKIGFSAASVTMNAK